MRFRYIITSFTVITGFIVLKDDEEFSKVVYSQIPMIVEWQCRDYSPNLSGKREEIEVHE